MKSFSKRFIGLLAITSSVFTHFCSDFNLSRVVVFTPESTKNILYSQRSSLFNGNPDFKLYLIQVLGARLRYVSCEAANMAQDIGTIRIISRSKYSLRNGCERNWFITSYMAVSTLKRQSWFTTWWDSFDHTYPSCGVGINSAGLYVDASHGTFLEGLAKIKEFYIGLKETFISEEESQYQVNQTANWLKNHVFTKEEALEKYQVASNSPNSIANEFAIAGGHLFDAFHAFFTQENASIILEDWKVSPLEILCVSSHESPQADFLNAIHELVNVIAAPSFESPRNVGYSGCHFSMKFMYNCYCPGTNKTEPAVPIITINLGMASPETLVAGHVLANNFNSLADGVMTYDSNVTIRGGCVLLIVIINDDLSPATLNNNDRRTALLDARGVVRSNCCQEDVLETNLSSGGAWELSRTTGPSEMSFEDFSRFKEPTHMMSNITSWLSEAFEAEYAFGDLKNMNAEILADATGETLITFCKRVRSTILFSLGTMNHSFFLFNFIPTGE